VSIAVDANLTKLDVLGLGATCLLEVTSNAVVIRHVIRSLRGDEEDGLLGKVDETARGRLLGLEDTLDEVLATAGLDLLDEIGGGVGDGRAVDEGNVSQTVGAGGLGAEDGVSEGRTRGFKKDEALGELGAGISDKNGHHTTLAVTKEDNRLANLVKKGSTSSLDGLLLVCGIVDKLDVGSIEGVKDRVSSLAGTRPLGVLLRLGPQVELLHGSEALLDDLGRVCGGLGSTGEGRPCRSSSEGLIDNINFVALVDELARPTAASVRLV
jgi:hypothetical protein